MDMNDVAPSLRHSAERHRHVLLWVIAGLLLLLAGRAIISDTVAVSNGDDPGRGMDFRITMFGPSTNISEGLDPWDIDNAVPRFGIFPPSPYLPSLYTPFPLIAAVAAATSAALLVAWSGVLTVLASSAIARALGRSVPASLIIGAIVVLSPVSRYNLFLGQFGVGALAAVAYFAVRSRPRPQVIDHVEAAVYLVTMCLFFVKPTFALTALAAELAFRRSAWCVAKLTAVVLALSAVMFAVISIRTDTGVIDLVQSVRSSSTELGGLEVNGLAGDRIDLPLLAVHSGVADLVAIAVCAALLVWINRLPDTTLLERLFFGLAAVTLLTYHHMYDTLPLLVVLLFLVTAWPLRRAVPLAVGLLVVGWVRDVGPVVSVWEGLTGAEWFTLRAKLSFALCVVVTAVMILDRRRRRSGGHDDPSDTVSEIGHV